jgi:hypothetical protein
MPGIDSDVKLLLHCNGIDGSTTFTDSSYSARTMTVFGDAQIDTAQSKFGGASGLFDGGSDYLDGGTNVVDFEFGSGDFTVDFWLKTSAGGGQWANPAISYGTGLGSGSSWKVMCGGYIYAYLWTVGGGNPGTQSTTATSDNNWHHVAFIREGNNIKLYIDGTLEATTDVTGLTCNDANDAILIVAADSAGSYFTGWLDEIRVSKGIARWTSNFTPPTEEYAGATTVQQDILSDAKIKVLDVQQNVLSDAELSPPFVRIYSDAKIKVLDIQKNIVADSILAFRYTDTIFSDAKLKIVNILHNVLSNSRLVIGVIIDIATKINTVKQIKVDISNAFNSVKQSVKDIGNFINTVKFTIIDISNDIRTQSISLKDVVNDVRFMLEQQLPFIPPSPPYIPGLGADPGFQSLGKSYIHIYFDSIEQTDIDVDSISVNKVLNGSHAASFDLSRPYDATKPSLETKVQIKYNTWLIYTGYIVEINPTESPERINIICNDKYWKENRQNKYFFVGHQPKDSQEIYYPAISHAINYEFNWSANNVGYFVPETIDCFAIGKSDALTTLIENSGNFAWYYDVDENRQLWEAGEGSTINIERQTLGENIGLYQVLSHQFKEDASNIVNKYRVQMGDKTTTFATYYFIPYITYLSPVWDSSLEVLAKNSSTGYGWDSPEPGTEDLYKDVFKKYRFIIPLWLQASHTSVSDTYPPKISISKDYSGSIHGANEGDITEGFTIDFDTQTVVFNTPIYVSYPDPTYAGEYYKTSSPQIKIFLWLKQSYGRIFSSFDNPETTISNPLMFFTVKEGSYPTTIMKELDLPNLSIQEADFQEINYGDKTKQLYSWDDSEFAEDYVYWLLSKTSEIKITGTIEVTLDAVQFYNINLKNRIYVAGITDEPMNIMSMDYNLSNFTVTINLENVQKYRRTVSLPYKGT